MHYMLIRLIIVLKKLKLYYLFKIIECNDVNLDIDISVHEISNYLCRIQ